MASGLNVNNDTYINISYDKIINEIIKEQTEGSLKVRAKEYHLLNISNLASKVAVNFKNNYSSIESILGIPNTEQYFSIFSTLKFKDELSQNKKFKELKDCFLEVINGMNITPANKDFYANDIKSRNYNLGINAGFKQTLSQVAELDSNCSNKDLSVRQDIVSVNMDVTNMEDDIEKSLINYYTRKFKDLDEDELECVLDRIKNREELVHKIRDYIITYRDGYLKRTIEGPIYLNFIKDMIDENKYIIDKHKRGYSLYAKYVQRINDFETFIQNSIVNDGDNMYQLEYMDKTLDFIHFIRTNSIYNTLPFTGKIEQSPLADIKLSDRSKGSEVYGISLKRNGKVQSDLASSSFEYHLNSLSKIFQELEKNEERLKRNLAKEENARENGKVVKPEELEPLFEIGDYGFEFIKALIYKYIFLNIEDDDYNAIEELKADLIKYKEDGLKTTEKVAGAIKELIVDVDIKRTTIVSQLNEIKNLIDECLDVSNSTFKKEYKKNFSILNAILPKSEDLDDGLLLEYLKVENYKYHKLFKYTTLLDEELNENYYAYSYSYNITITSDIFSKTDSVKDIKVEFDRKYFNPFNIVFYPKINEIKDCGKEYAIDAMKYYTDSELKLKQCREYPAVFMDYSNNYENCCSNYNKNEKEIYRFVYETSYTLITTVLCNLIAEKLSYKIPLYTQKINKLDDEQLKQYKTSTDKCLYLILSQLTFNKEVNNKAEFNRAQSFVYELRKGLASALSVNYTSNSQGMNVLGNSQKAGNVTNSAFSKVHKIVTLPKPIESFDKLAIIVASSRQHNCAKYNRNMQDVTVHGEIIAINVDKNCRNKITIIPYSEFTQFISKSELHKKPTSLSDKVKELTNKGFKDIVYLAKSPFTANMIEKRTETEMYFMNEEVIKTMTDGIDDVKIYPLYINNCKIHADNSLKNKNSNINLASVRNIYENVNEEFEGIVPIFQIFSDNAVNTKGDNFYNEMIMYSTIKGIYSQDIQGKLGSSNLLSNSCNNSYVNDLKYIMTSIHIVRNDKYVYGTVKKSMKNNPFQTVLDTTNGTNGKSISKYLRIGSRGKDKEFTLNRFSLISYISNVSNDENIVK